MKMLWRLYKIVYHIIYIHFGKVWNNYNFCKKKKKQNKKFLCSPRLHLFDQNFTHIFDNSCQIKVMFTGSMSRSKVISVVSCDTGTVIVGRSQMCTTPVSSFLMTRVTYQMR